MKKSPAHEKHTGNTSDAHENGLRTCKTHRKHIRCARNGLAHEKRIGNTPDVHEKDPHMKNTWESYQVCIKRFCVTFSESHFPKPKNAFRTLAEHNSATYATLLAHFSSFGIPNINALFPAYRFIRSLVSGSTPLY